MKRFIFTMVAFFVIISQAFTQTGKDLKVFISVDMEGITGVVNSEEVSRDGKDYDYFRKIMTNETNAAIEGAVAAGAKEIWVRDSHGTGRNILPDILDKRAKLLRDWSGGYLSMMEGIDKTFDAVIFIGYHAKAGTPNATLEHTMSSVNITDVSINGISLPEAGINALIAGYFNVPVVLLSGDKAICEQSKAIVGNIETVAVKENFGKATLNLHPEIARDKIRESVNSALQNLKKYKPYTLNPPYKLVITLKTEDLVYEKSFYPGAKRTGDLELTYTSSDLMEVIKAFSFMH